MDVLLVEDEPSIADTVLYALESEGLVCECVSTGEAAIKRVAEAAPRLVLLDIGLPDINGFDVFKALRAQSPVKIVFLTSRSSEVDQVVGLELGAEDYVVKPFSPRVLSAKVRRYLRSETPVVPGVAPGPLFRDDPEGQRILYKGTALNLTRYEYGIFSVLLKHPGRIYSRDALMQAVWTDPGESYDRTVDAHIKSLRKKLQSVAPDLEHIKTHRGMGYCYAPLKV